MPCSSVVNKATGQVCRLAEKKRVGDFCTAKSSRGMGTGGGGGGGG